MGRDGQRLFSSSFLVFCFFERGQVKRQKDVATALVSKLRFAIVGIGASAGGVEAIEAHAEAASARSPDSSKFDGMPSSAVESGGRDLVAPAGDLVGKILAILQRAPDLAAELRLSWAEMAAEKVRNQ